MDGFSLRGKMNEIEQLKKEGGIQAVTEVSVYQAVLDKSVPYIGGDRVRGSLIRRITGSPGKG